MHLIQSLNILFLFHLQTICNMSLLSLYRYGHSCRIASKQMTMKQNINITERSYHFKKSHFTDRQSTIMVGAVSYCDGVSTIWEGMKQHFIRNEVNLDFVLFTSYERQLEALVSGKNYVVFKWDVPHRITAFS